MEFICGKCHATIGEGQPWGIKDGQAFHQTCTVRKSSSKSTEKEREVAAPQKE